MTIRTNLPQYGNIFFCGDTFDDLRSISPLNITDGSSAIIKGRTTPADGHGGLFTWLPASTAPDNDETVLAPTVGNLGRWIKIAVATRSVDLDLLGAAADGTTDDRVALQTAISVSDRLTIPTGTYRVGSIPQSEFDWQAGPQPALILQPSIRAIDGQGSTLLLSSSSRGIMGGSMWSNHHTNHFDPSITGTIATDLVAGTRTIPLSAGDGAKFTIGCTVVLQLGELAYDRPEPDEWFFARVTAISGDTLTIDRPVTRPLIVTNQTSYGKFVRRWTLFENLIVSDLTINGPDGDRYENGIGLFGGRNLTFERVGGKNIGATVIGGQYCENVTLDNCWGETSKITQASYGRAFAFAECRNVVMNNCRATATSSFCGVEANTTISINSPLFENTLLNSAGVPYGSFVTAFLAAGRSLMTVRDATITGYGGFILSTDQSHTGEAYRSSVNFLGTTRMSITSDPFAMDPRSINGLLDLEIAGVREVYDFARPITWKRRVNLKNGMYADYLRGPAGALMIEMRVYCSPGLAGKLGAGQSVPGFFAGQGTDNGPNRASSLVAGSEIVFSGGLGTVGGQSWIQRASSPKLLITTASGSDLDAAGEFIEVTVMLSPRVAYSGNPTTTGTWTESDWRGQGGDADVREARFPAYDLPSVAAAATLQVDLAIPAMAAGDFIESVSLSGGLAGLSIRSTETVAGACRIVFENQTAVAIDRAPTNLIVEWSKPTL